jgi:hypothetical protein
MRLGAVLALPRIFRIFLQFILIFLELFLFIRRLKHQILYLDCSCLNLSLGIFLKFLEFFSSIFHAFKTISRFSGIVLN